MWESVLLETFKSRNGLEFDSNSWSELGVFTVVFEGSRVVREFFGYEQAVEQ